MRNTKAYQAIQKTAEQFGVSVEEMIAEIEMGISEAMQNPDSRVQENWKEMPWGGREPSAEEFVEYISSMLKKEE